MSFEKVRTGMSKPQVLRLRASRSAQDDTFLVGQTVTAMPVSRLVAVSGFGQQRSVVLHGFGLGLGGQVLLRLEELLDGGDDGVAVLRFEDLLAQGSSAGDAVGEPGGELLHLADGVAVCASRVRSGRRR